MHIFLCLDLFLFFARQINTHKHNPALLPRSPYILYTAHHCAHVVGGAKACTKNNPNGLLYTPILMRSGSWTSPVLLCVAFFSNSTIGGLRGTVLVLGLLPLINGGAKLEEHLTLGGSPSQKLSAKTHATYGLFFMRALSTIYHNCKRDTVCRKTCLGVFGCYYPPQCASIGKK